MSIFAVRKKLNSNLTYFIPYGLVKNFLFYQWCIHYHLDNHWRLSSISFLSTIKIKNNENWVFVWILQQDFKLNTLFYWNNFNHIYKYYIQRSQPLLLWQFYCEPYSHPTFNLQAMNLQNSEKNKKNWKVWINFAFYSFSQQWHHHCTWVFYGLLVQRAAEWTFKKQLSQLIEKILSLSGPLRAIN